MNFTKEQIKQAAKLRFDSSDLGQNITVSEWLKRLLLMLIDKEEGFSGKRPFGNSGWKQDVEAAMIKAGLIAGTLDGNGYVESSDDIDELLDVIVESWK